MTSTGESSVLRIPSSVASSSPRLALAAPVIGLSVAAALDVGAVDLSHTNFAPDGGTIAIVAELCGETVPIRAVELLMGESGDAVARYFDLLSRLTRVFEGQAESISTRIVEAMPDEGDGPYIFVDVRTKMDVAAAYRRLEEFERSWWLENQLPLVSVALRFT